MKKLAIGCLVVFVIGAAAAVGGGYYLYSKGRSMFTQLAELRQIPEIEQGVRIKTPYSAPPSGDLTTEQLDKFMKVQATVRERLGKNMDALQRNYKSLSDKKDATIADLPQILSAYRDVAASWLDAKRTQVAALNDAGLSMDEYRWIRSRVYQALNVPFVAIDFAQIAEQTKAGVPTGDAMFANAYTGPVSPGTATLVEKFREKLMDNLPMATFGL
ncbi:MAG: hypothetical protein ACRD1V_17110 [Vicinamibacterales bacterium]